MTINEFPSVPTDDDRGRDADRREAAGCAPARRDTCSRCDVVYRMFDAAGIVYEIIDTCVWCGARPIDPSPELEGCCGEDCRYQLARDEGWVSDSEHAEFIAEGWVA